MAESAFSCAIEGWSNDDNYALRPDFFRGVATI